MSHFYRTVFPRVVPQLRGSIFDLSQRKASFGHRPFHSEFVVENLALVEDFLPSVFLVSVIPPLPHIHSFVYHRH
jgi:hypothetical protein